MKHMKTFNLFLNENKLEYSKLKKWAISYATKYYKINPELRNDVINSIDDFFTNDFPYGINNIPKKVILYRIVGISLDGDNENDSIDLENLGTHFVGDLNIIDDDFIISIGYEYDEMEEYSFKIIKIQTDITNIDLKETLKNRVLTPHEFEYTIKNSSNIKILDISDY